MASIEKRTMVLSYSIMAFAQVQYGLGSFFLLSLLRYTRLLLVQQCD